MQIINKSILLKSKFLKNIFSIVVCMLFINQVFAQSGGPPMLTDDPGVVDLHKWEINTSVNVTISDKTEISFPHFDFNYGLAPNLQLKVEAQYNSTFQKNEKNTGSLGDISLGTKFRFLGEDKHFISMATFPQLTISGNKGFLLPLLLEKTFGKFLAGYEIGSYWGSYNSVQTGLLFGYTVSKKTQIMSEYFMEKELNSQKGSNGFLNIGFRQSITKIFTIIGSAGTQITSTAGEQKDHFISYLGIQSSF